MRGRGVIIRVVVGIVFAAAACSTDGDANAPGTAAASSISPAPTAEAAAPFAGVDLVVTVIPGSGHGPQADELAGSIADPIPGSANHLATIATEDGPVSIVAYQEIMQERGISGNMMFCVAEIGPNGAGSGCSGQPTTQPEAGSVSFSDGTDGRTSITAYGGEDAPFAVVVTEQNARIGIVTARGWAYAEWPSSWGMPDTITFYDKEGTPGFSSRYDW